LAFLLRVLVQALLASPLFVATYRALSGCVLMLWLLWFARWKTRGYRM